MPADVETMMYVRDVPWHGTGVKANGLQKAEDAIELGGLNWDVIQTPLYIQPNPNSLEMGVVSSHVANIRSTDKKILGVVGKGYKPIQNSTAFSFMDSIVDSGEAKYETVGSLKEGKVIFISMELPKHIRVPGDDSEVKPYILLANGHDGGHALQVIVTPVRVVCSNTLAMAIGRGRGKAKDRFYMRHTSGIEERIGAARQAIGLSFDYLEKFEEIAGQLAAVRISPRIGEGILSEVFPLTEREKESIDLKDRSNFAKALAVWKRSDDLDSIRKTGWGLLNAVAEYIDHGIDYRSRTYTPADRKADSLLFGGTGAKAKSKVIDLVLS